MYITDINGREIIFYNDRIEFETLTIPYDEMKNITQSFDGQPVFRFEFRGRDLRIPCREDEYKVVLEYFRIAADKSQKTDPLEFLSDDKSSEYIRQDHAEFVDDHLERGGVSYTYNYYGDTFNNSTRDEYGAYNGFSQQEGAKSINKHLYVWLCSFFFGLWGVDRFFRGQIGLGLLKFFTGGVCGIMYLYDWIQAMTKAYGAAYRNTEDLYFTYDGQFTR